MNRLMNYGTVALGLAILGTDDIVFMSGVSKLAYKLYTNSGFSLSVRSSHSWFSSFI